jgi:putative FmdB family regulatory protein
MPIYEYQCDSCGIIFEARQKFSDAPLESCSTCGGKVQKMISRTGFSLKGGGWYEQGYGAAPTCGGGDSAGCGGCPKAANS